MKTHNRRRAFSLVLLSLLILVFSPVLLASEPDPPLFNEQRARTTRAGMAFLGGWALTNLAAGTPLYFTSSGETQAFHEMNVLWNVVNLGIAGAGYLGSRGTPTENSLADALRAQRSIESSLLFNMGLDVGYMAAGWALLERSQRDVPDAERWAGYGRALLLQGGFLFAFDVGFYLFQTRNRPEI